MSAISGVTIYTPTLPLKDQLETLDSSKRPQNANSHDIMVYKPLSIKGKLFDLTLRLGSEVKILKEISTVHDVRVAMTSVYRYTIKGRENGDDLVEGSDEQIEELIKRIYNQVINR